MTIPGACDGDGMVNAHLFEPNALHEYAFTISLLAATASGFLVTIGHSTWSVVTEANPQ